MSSSKQLAEWERPGGQRLEGDYSARKHCAAVRLMFGWLQDNPLFQLLIIQLATLATALGSLVTALIAALAV